MTSGGRGQAAGKNIEHRAQGTREEGVVARQA